MTTKARMMGDAHYQFPCPKTCCQPHEFIGRHGRRRKQIRSQQRAREIGQFRRMLKNENY
jgi:hypothetical protein